MRCLQFLAVAIVGTCAAAYAGGMHDALTQHTLLQSTLFAQPVELFMNGTGEENLGPRSGTMRFERNNEVELLFENVRRLLAQGDHAGAMPLLQEALDIVVNQKVLDGETFRHPWFQALSLLRAFPPDARVLIERYAGARAAAALELAWRENDMKAIERVAIQFRYTAAGRDALRLLAGCALDQGDYLIASAWYARLFEEEPDPLQAAAQDPGSLLKWLECESRLDNSAGIARLWKRYQSEVAAKLVQANGDTVSVQSWLMNQGLLPTSEPETAETDAELATLIPTAVAAWEFSTEDASELRKESRPVLELLSEYGMTGMHAAPAQVFGDFALVSSIGGLSCLNLTSGELVWRKEFEVQRISTSYAGGGGLDTTRRSLGGGLYDQFTCDGSTVYYLSEDAAIHSANEGTIRRRNRLVACDLRTGDIRWELQDVRIAGDRRARVASQYFLCAPVVDGSRLYIMGQESFQITEQSDGAVQLLILDAHTGESISAIELGPANRSLATDLHRQEFGGRIALQGELVICATGWGSVMGVDPTARVMRWAHTFPRLNLHVPTASGYYSYGPPAMIGWEWWRGWRGVTLEAAGDFTVFASPEADRLIVYDYRSGQIVWERPRGFGRYVAAVLSDRVLVANSHGIDAFALATGGPLWSTSTPPLVGYGFVAGDAYVAPVGDGGSAAIDINDGRLLFESRQTPQLLMPAAVGLTSIYEPASLVHGGDALLRITAASVTRMQPLAQQGARLDVVDTTTPDQRLQQALQHEELGRWEEADRMLASLMATEPEVTALAEKTRAELLLRHVERGGEISGEHAAFLRASPLGRDYMSLLVRQRLSALQPADRETANATVLSASDAKSLLDEILTIMADSPELVFFNASQGRRVRLDRYLQGAILTLLEHVEASSRTDFEFYLANELQTRFESAANARELWKWITRCDHLPWGQAYAVKPGSIAGLTGGERLLREMLLWELSLSENRSIAVQAVMRLAELPSSRVDGIPELLLQRIMPHLESALHDGRTVAEIVDADQGDTVWPLALAAADAPFWPEALPEVSERGRPLATASRRTVHVASRFPTPLERYNVEVMPAAGVPNFVRFGGVADDFWSAEILGVSRLEEYVASPYTSDPSEFTRAWNVGRVIYLQTGASLSAYRPFDEQGEPQADTAWPRQMRICSTGAVDFQITKESVERRHGVRETEMIYTDSFGYRVDTFGPFQSGFFCTPETGDLVVRSSATGRELWSIPVTTSSRWIANDDVVVVYDEQTWRFAVRRAVDGELLATHVLPARPLDVLQSAGATLLLEMPVDIPEADEISQLVAWDAQQGTVAWSYPLSVTSMVFLVDQQLIGMVDRVSEQIDLIDIRSGAIACSHSPDRPDQVDDIHCVVDADQLIVVVKRAGGDGEGQVVVRDPRSIRLNGTLHAFDRKNMTWTWSHNIKDIDLHLDQPNHVPLLVMHENTYYVQDPFAFSEMPITQTKLRFAVLDRRTGDMLVNETLEYTSTAPFEWTVDVDADERIVDLRTNAGTGFRFDYRPTE